MAQSAAISNGKHQSSIAEAPSQAPQESEDSDVQQMQHGRRRRSRKKSTPLPVSQQTKPLLVSHQTMPSLLGQQTVTLPLSQQAAEECTGQGRLATSVSGPGLSSNYPISPATDPGSAGNHPGSSASFMSPASDGKTVVVNGFRRGLTGPGTKQQVTDICQQHGDISCCWLRKGKSGFWFAIVQFAEVRHPHFVQASIITSANFAQMHSGMFARQLLFCGTQIQPPAPHVRLGVACCFLA